MKSFVNIKSLEVNIKQQVRKCDICHNKGLFFLLVFVFHPMHRKLSILSTNCFPYCFTNCLPFLIFQVLQTLCQNIPLSIYISEVSLCKPCMCLCVKLCGWVEEERLESIVLKCVKRCVVSLNFWNQKKINTICSNDLKQHKYTHVCNHCSTWKYRM